jgi:tetratricopeptide (TPR) repeat protein
MAYQFHDQMLGTLLAKAGEDVTVILMSDHGFHPDHLRPSKIPDIPAGPAIEHRDFGILTMSGPGLKRDELLHGPSVLDIAPTILTLYGLAVGEDMDGQVLSQAFEDPPQPKFIPSWEDVAGETGTHPAHTRLDPVAAHEAMEQMIALGYIERPDENREIAVEKTIRELRYNLGESYQDDGRHLEAQEIFRELRRKDPDEQRFAVKLFIACQALGMTGEMREIVDDLDGRRRVLYQEAMEHLAKLKAGADPETVLDDAQKKELKHWGNLARYQPAVIDYLKAQVLTAEKRYAEALEALGRVRSVDMVRPGLFLQSAELYMKLGRWREAEEVYRKALGTDPDSAAAWAGIARIELRRRRFDEAAQAALDAVQRVYQYPVAHYLLGLALVGRKEFERAVEAFETAISLNPNFPEAHMRLAAVLEKKTGDAAGAEEHRRLARVMRRRRSVRRPLVSAAERVEQAVSSSGSGDAGVAAPIGESLIVVSGLPRSGTSMLMQMLAAGGVAVMSDGLREADEDNPRGYLEYEPVKSLLKDASWLGLGRGKAIKIVAPLLGAVPAELPCRVIFVERDLEEVLDSQARMLVRRGKEIENTAERRGLLKSEYVKTVARVKAMLGRRAETRVLSVEYRETVSNPGAIAARVNEFLGGGLDVGKMALAVDAALHRNRA